MSANCEPFCSSHCALQKADYKADGKITPGNPFAYLGRKHLHCGKYNFYLVMFMLIVGEKCLFGGILLIGIH